MIINLATKIQKKGGEYKMKKTMFVLLGAMFMLGLTTMSYAQATTATVTATAKIDSELRLTASVLQVDSKNTDSYTDDTWNSTPVTTMSFGTLTHFLADGTTEAGLLYSRPYYYVALLGGFTSGRRYRIQSSCVGLLGPVTLTKGFGVTYLDGNPKKADGSNINTTTMTGTLGTVGSATVSNKTLYDSGTAGTSRVIAAYFGIPPYSTSGTLPGDLQPIPTDTVSGDYSANVIFSITLY